MKKELAQLKTKQLKLFYNFIQHTCTNQSGRASVEEQELKFTTIFLCFVIVIKLIFTLKVLKEMLTSWRNKEDTKRLSFLLLTFCRRRI